MTPELTSAGAPGIDRDNMWGKLVDFPRQWSEAIALTEETDWAIEPQRVRNICLAGMGGSAIGGDLIRTYTAGSTRFPFVVNRHYEVPGWVDRHTLFIASSYSGNTEETLAAMGEAVSRGAQVVAITSGGRLLVEASREGYGYVKIPGGLPPRSALAYSFVPLFRLFHTLGCIDEPQQVLERTGRMLGEQVQQLSDPENSRALQIARKLLDTLPVIYTGPGLLESVGMRWRCQFEENSKLLSYGNTVPEMNHNEIVGWEQVAHLTGRISVLILEDEQEHEKVRQRMEIVREMVDGLAVYVTKLRTSGESRLSRQFSLVQLGDWVSLYLALINSVDPTPIAKIDLLKSRLAEL